MTDRFTISDQYLPVARDYLEQVVRESKLPEGITIIPSLPENALPSAPFLVAAYYRTLENAIAAYRAGALNYLLLDFNHEGFLKELNGDT